MSCQARSKGLCRSQHSVLQLLLLAVETAITCLHPLLQETSLSCSGTPREPADAPRSVKLDLCILLRSARPRCLHNAERLKFLSAPASLGRLAGWRHDCGLPEGQGWLASRCLCRRDRRVAWGRVAPRCCEELWWPQGTWLSHRAHFLRLQEPEERCALACLALRESIRRALVHRPEEPCAPLDSCWRGAHLDIADCLIWLLLQAYVASGQPGLGIPNRHLLKRCSGDRPAHRCLTAAAAEGAGRRPSRSSASWPNAARQLAPGGRRSVGRRSLCLPRGLCSRGERRCRRALRRPCPEHR